MTLSQRWDLNECVANTHNMVDIRNLLLKVQHNIDDTKMAPIQSEQDFQTIVLMIQDIMADISEIESYALCRTAQDVNDPEAIELQESYIHLKVNFNSLLSTFDTQLRELQDEQFEQYCKNSYITPIADPLRERRRIICLKLDPQSESLIETLSINGLHGWRQLYEAMIGSMRISLIQNEETKFLSCEQARNLLSSPDRNIRKQVFENWESACKERESDFAQALNHISGFRIQVCKKREWNIPLQEPLDINRMQEQSLQAMIHAVEESKDLVGEFLRKKAEILQLPKLSWYDLDAPIAQVDKKISYDEAIKIITQAFAKFSPHMSHLVTKATKNRWLEVENRLGKAPGGFCTGFPQSKQSRIFMTYSGTMDNVIVLAHELGHAYHNEVIFKLPRFAHDYSMSLAELASTLAERIVLEDLLERANNQEEKVFLAHDKCLRAVMFLCNILARYRFECTFYEKRKNGFVSPQSLSDLMEEAQRHTYGEYLDISHPHFWITKQHFYLIEWPFYNFPYTIGYLFSLAVYKWGKEQPEQFQTKYDELLLDTGRLSMEEVAHKHLGANIQEKTFWKEAVGVALSDIEQFHQLV